MALYQYIGKEYTLISLKEGELDVKVVEGEIVESDRCENRFTSNRFIEVDKRE
jgi:hypothetical protein